MNIQTQNFSNPTNLRVSRLERPKSGKVTVTYQEPVTESVELGKIPKSYRDDVIHGESALYQFRPGHNSPDLHPGMLKPVTRDQPVLENGEVKFRETQETFDLSPISGMRQAVEAAGLGSAAGVVLGGALGALLVSATFPVVAIGAAVGSAVVGAGAAVAGYKKNAGRTKELKWVKTPVVEHELLGYRTDITRHSESGPDEYNRRSTFYRSTSTPWVDTTQKASWMKPVVVLEGEEPPSSQESEQAWHQVLR